MSKTNSGVQHGLRSPMNGTNGMNVHMPKVADNTMLGRKPPTAAPMQSPTKPKNPAK